MNNQTKVLLAAMISIGYLEVYVDGKKKYTLNDNQIWQTIPKLAQERASGKKVKTVQVLDNGERIEFEGGSNMEKLLSELNYS